jgi:hypothetical protein
MAGVDAVVIGGIRPSAVCVALTPRRYGGYPIRQTVLLDRSRLASAYAGTGSQPDYPAMPPACSPAARAQATDDSIAFRDIGASTHPDYRTIADFRTLSRRAGGAVHRGANRCAGDGAGEARHPQSRRDQDQSKRSANDLVAPIPSGRSVSNSGAGWVSLCSLTHEGGAG